MCTCLLTSCVHPRGIDSGIYRATCLYSTSFPSVSRMSTPITILLGLCSGYLHAVGSEQACDFISRAQNPLKRSALVKHSCLPSPIISPSRNFPSASNTLFATVSTWVKPPKCLRCKEFKAQEYLGGSSKF
jgi:hypothetical protein